MPRLILILLLGSACGGDDCSGIDDPEDLWPRAARVRVDVYGEAVQCDHAVVKGAGAPLLSRLYAPSDSITLDLRDGQYTIAVTLFADVEATQLLGSACQRQQLGAGSHTCLRFHLESPPDGAIGEIGPPAGCASAADCAALDGGAALACCGGRCVDPRNDPAHCGSCEISCGGNHTAAVCNNGLCSTKCEAGWGDCLAAPGCETNLAEEGVKICGSTCIPSASCCTSDDCVFPPAPAACFVATCSGPGGACSYPMIPGAAVCGPICCNPQHAECATDCSLTCASDYHDCNGAAADGCECQGDGCCGAGCQVKHTNGVGQSFFSCAPLGTFDLDQATAACVAFTGDAAACHALSCGNPNQAVCSDGSAVACDCWIYGDSSGKVRLNAPGQCNCKNNGSSAVWN
jgi:hypothetical protein